MPLEALIALVHQVTSASPHVAAEIVQEYAVGKTGDFVVGTIFRGLRNAINPGFRSEIDLQADDIRALRLVVKAVVERLDELPAVSDGRRQPDRATDEFVSDALQAALETPFAAKQVLIGRLIAERLSVETESSDDLFLREAARIVRESNQAQLFSLGTLYLVHHPPESYMPHEDLREWWDADYFPILQRMVGGGWDEDDLDYLERLGAVDRDRLASSNALVAQARSGSAINTVLQRRGLEHADTSRSTAERVSNFAIYCARLHNGTADTTAWPALKFPLFAFGLTVPGRRVARTIIESVSGYTLEEARGATTYPFGDRAVTPGN